MKTAHFPNCVAVSLLKLLRRGFFALGNIVGTHRVLTICISLVFCTIASSGLLKFNIDYNLRDRYAPYGAVSRLETQVYENFFTEKGEAWDAYVMIQALDGGSMLRKDLLDAAYNISEFIENEFSILDNSGNQFKFGNFCEPHCQPNKAFRMFVSGFKIMYSRIADNATFDINQIKLDYPYTEIFGTKIDMVPIFFGTERNESFATERTVNGSSDYAKAVTPITDVKLVLLSYKATVPDEESREAIREWELRVFNHLRDLDHPLINATIFGDKSICSEVSESGMVVVPYFLLGFTVLLIFSVASVAMSSKYQCFKKQNVIAMSLVMVAGVISPVLASGASFGIAFYILPTFDSVLVVTPFLVLAIGVDDAFLMIHAWQQVKHKDAEPGHRLAVVMAETGPSILITSLTNALAFAVGGTASTPAIRSFCLATALAMIVDLVMELTLFAAILASSVKLEKILGPKSGTASPASGFQSRRWSISSGIIKRQNRIAPALTRLSSLENGPIRAIPTQSSVTVIGKFLERYCKIISSKWASLGAFLFLAAYWTFVGFGAYHMRAELSSEKLFLRSSPLYSGEKARSNYIFDKYHTVTVVVNKAPNFSNPEEYALFQEMVSEFESLPDAIGPKSTRVWLKDYESFEDEMIKNYGETCGMGEGRINTSDEDYLTEEEEEEEYEYVTYPPEDESYTDEEYYQDEKEPTTPSADPTHENNAEEEKWTDDDETTISLEKLEEIQTTLQPHSRKPQTTIRPKMRKGSVTKKGRSKRQSNDVISPILTNKLSVVDTSISYKCLHFFLRNDFTYWEPYVHAQDLDTDPKVTGFIFTTAYENSTSWSKRLFLTQKWREISAKYSGVFETSAYNRDGLYYDQLLTVRGDTLKTVVMTFGCMAVVCYFLIPSLASCICASLSVASISIGVYGCLSWWSIDLDPFTMGSLIMSIGFSVDYTAHISYHYFKGSSEEIVNTNYQASSKSGKGKNAVSNREVNSLNAVNTLRKRLSMIPEEGNSSMNINPAKRLQDALSAVGWPMIQAAISTLCCIIALCLVDSYMIEVFRKTVFLVVLLGLIHGLVILPAILAALPNCVIGTGCVDQNCVRGFWSKELESSDKPQGVVVLPPVQKLETPSPFILDSGYASPVTPSSRTISVASLSVPLEVSFHENVGKEKVHTKSRLTRTLSGVPFSVASQSLSPKKAEKF